MNSRGPRRLLIATTVVDTLRAFLLPHADHLRRNGWEVHAIARGASTDPDVLAHFDRVFDCQWSRRPTDMWSAIRGVRTLRAVVEEHGYDIVHVHTPVAAFLTRIALRDVRRRRGTRVVYTAHGFHFHRRGGRLANTVYLGLERIARRWMDFLIVINREDYSAASRHRLAPPDRVALLPGIGLDTSKYDPAAVPQDEVVEFRKSLGLHADDILFTIVAELNPGKRHEDVVRAIARVADQRVHLAIAGQGPLEARLRSVAKEIGVSDRVHMLGYRQDVPTIMRASAGTILPSDREGLPRVVMESLCLGVPVIGSDARGVEDLITGIGSVVPVGDVEAYACAIAALANDPREAVRRLEDARQSIIATYDVATNARYHEAIYQEILSRASAA